MSLNLGWGTVSDPLFGVRAKKISNAEWTFTLYDHFNANPADEWVTKLFNTELNAINDPWVAVGCHMSFLTTSAVKRNHDYHVVIEVYSREKVANKSFKGASWRDRPDTSQDAYFRLVYQYDGKRKFLREGMLTYAGPERPPGIDRPYTFTKYQDAADQFSAKWTT